MAGESKRKKKEFFAEHPKCCFCGGSANASTRDHLPPRSSFFKKQWPEGYVFPACEACNRGSSDRDRLFAFLVKTRIDKWESFEHQEEQTRLLRGIHAANPNTVRTMLMSTNEKKRAIRSRAPLPPLFQGIATGEMPLLGISNELHAAVHFVLGKLAKALHYKHTGRIVPKDVSVGVNVYTNLNLLSGVLDKTSFVDLPVLAIPKCCGKDLSDQFMYRYGHTPDLNHSLFACKFGEALVTTLQVSCVPLFDEVEENNSVDEVD